MKYINQIFGDYTIVKKLPNHYSGKTTAYIGVCSICGNEKVSTIYRFRDNCYAHSFKNCTDTYVEYEYVGKQFEDMKILEHRLEDSTRYLDIECVLCNRQKTVQYHDIISLKLGAKHGQGCARVLKVENIRFYDIWSAIKKRCDNPNNHNYKNYGGRGIVHEYEQYVDFYDDMYESYLEHCILNGESETTIERIDVNGNYTRENLTWTTKARQNQNRTNNKDFVATSPDGLLYECVTSIRSFAKEYNLNDSSISRCLRGLQKSHKGWKFNYKTIE